MAVSLQKGGNVSLSKEAPGLTEVTVGLGWDARVTDGSKFDLDASIFILGESGQVLDDASFIFYNNKKSVDGSVEHMGDNQSGEGEGDDEQATVKLNGDRKRVGWGKRVAVGVNLGGRRYIKKKNTNNK